MDGQCPTPWDTLEKWFVVAIQSHAPVVSILHLHLPLASFLLIFSIAKFVRTNPLTAEILSLHLGSQVGKKIRPGTDKNNSSLFFWEGSREGSRQREIGKLRPDASHGVSSTSQYFPSKGQVKVNSVWWGWSWVHWPRVFCSIKYLQSYCAAPTPSHLHQNLILYPILSYDILEGAWTLQSKRAGFKSRISATSGWRGSQWLLVGGRMGRSPGDLSGGDRGGASQAEERQAESIPVLVSNLNHCPFHRYALCNELSVLTSELQWIWNLKLCGSCLSYFSSTIWERRIPLSSPSAFQPNHLPSWFIVGSPIFLPVSPLSNAATWNSLIYA